jgi:hypothetical protein
MRMDCISRTKAKLTDTRTATRSVCFTEELCFSQETNCVTASDKQKLQATTVISQYFYFDP